MILMLQLPKGLGARHASRCHSHMNFPPIREALVFLMGCVQMSPLSPNTQNGPGMI